MVLTAVVVLGPAGCSDERPAGYHVVADCMEQVQRIIPYVNHGQHGTRGWPECLRRGGDCNDQADKVRRLCRFEGLEVDMIVGRIDGAPHAWCEWRAPDGTDYILDTVHYRRPVPADGREAARYTYRK